MKTIFDPVHGLIEMDVRMAEVVDTPQFQRLRELKQLGACYYVFPGASHNRFEHSIGTMHLAEEMLQGLQARQPSLEINESDMYCVKMAALCHDLGHGPFSHVFDNQFIKTLKPELHWHHEQASEMMLDYLIDDNNIDIDESDLKSIHKLINPEGYTNGFLFDVVSNSRNSVDVDKFDYLQRDCLNLGVKSSYDPSRLMKYCRVIENEVCFPAKEAYNLYEMFHTRYSLFKQIYQHPVTKAIELMICDAMFEANSTLNIADAIHDKESYLHLTDVILCQIEYSKEPALAKARAIVKRIRVRDLYKVVNSALIPKNLEYTAEQFTVENILACASELAIDAGLTANDLIVDTYKINYAFKEKNPVDHVHFFDADNLSRKFLIGREKVSSLIPDRFSELYIRLYTRDSCKIKFEAAQNAFDLFLKKKFMDQVRASPAVHKSKIKSAKLSTASRIPFTIPESLVNSSNMNVGFSMMHVPHKSATLAPVEMKEDLWVTFSQEANSNSPCPTPRHKRPRNSNVDDFCDLTK